MKPNQFHVRVRAADGTIWLTHERSAAPVRPLKDITNDILLALCADVSNEDGARAIERCVEFSDGMRCVITVALERAPSNLEVHHD